MALPAVHHVVDARIPTAINSQFRLTYFSGFRDQREHLAITLGDLGQENVLIRVHSECFTGEVMGSLRCDCGPQLQNAMKAIALEGAGVILYLKQEGRGIGLAAKLSAYNLQDLGHNTVDANLLLGRGADEREYSAAASMLQALQIRSVRILTNNPSKMKALEELGVRVLERVPLVAGDLSLETLNYLHTKVVHMNHMISLDHLQSERDLNLSRTNSSMTAEGNSQNTNLIRELPSLSLIGEGNLHNTSVIREMGMNTAAIVGTTTTNRHANKQTLHHHGGQWHPTLLNEQSRALSNCDRPGSCRVTVTYAQSLDGVIGAVAGQPRLILSGDESMRMTHELRAAHEAILVGVNTVINDNPMLTVRLVSGSNPQPVILDSHLRTPVEAKLLGRHPWIFCRTDACAGRQRILEGLGCRVFRTAHDSDGHPSWEAVLHTLSVDLHVHSLMVEGGAAVIRSCLSSHAATHLVVTTAPVVIGASSSSSVSPYTIVQSTYWPKLSSIEYRQCGSDMVMFARVGSLSTAH